MHRRKHCFVDRELVDGKKFTSVARGSNIVPKIKRTGVQPLGQWAGMVMDR